MVRGGIRWVGAVGCCLGGVIEGGGTIQPAYWDPPPHGVATEFQSCQEVW